MLVAMHAPDGFLGPGVAAFTAVISIVVIGLALRHASAELDDRQVPLAGGWTRWRDLPAPEGGTFRTEWAKRGRT